MTKKPFRDEFYEQKWHNRNYTRIILSSLNPSQTSENGDLKNSLGGHHAVPIVVWSNDVHRTRFVTILVLTIQFRSEFSIGANVILYGQIKMSPQRTKCSRSRKRLISTTCSRFIYTYEHNNSIHSIWENIPHSIPRAIYRMEIAREAMNECGIGPLFV